MDEFNMKIKHPFTKNILSSAIEKFLINKLGFDSRIDINELDISQDDSGQSLKIHINTEIVVNKNKLLNYISNYI